MLRSYSSPKAMLNACLRNNRQLHLLAINLDCQKLIKQSIKATKMNIVYNDFSLLLMTFYFNNYIVYDSITKLV